MAEADPLRKYVEAGIAFTQLTKAKAEAVVRELVKAGDLQREHAQDRVDDLLDRSRKSTEGLVGIVRREIAAQLSSLGLATKDDVDKLAAKMDAHLAATPTPPPPAARKAAKAGARPSKAVPTPPPGTAARTVGATSKAPRRRPDAPAKKA